MFHILRAIHFNYGHRLLNHPGKCARLHGHNAKLVIQLSSRTLNRQKMVRDFYDVRKTVEGWIDEHLDHRMILSKADPLVKILQKAGEPVVVIPDNPTAEVLVQRIFNAARKLGLPVTKAVLWETEDSAAVYSS